MRATVRVAIVVIAICAWFAISNHCAFAALATKTDSVQTGCPFHSKPKEKPSTGVQCCKVLRAVASVATKSWTRDDTSFSRVDPVRVERTGTEHLRDALSSSFLDTGPPNARSFTELILQRSLFAHAPPALG